MLNCENREWVENALASWRSRQPSRKISRKLIEWNIAHLERFLLEINRV